MEDWPVPEGLRGRERSLAWLVPCSTVVLNIATVLTYDVGATIRVQQFRHLGIDTRSSIILAGVEGSNEVFVSAIMTMVSFSGLLFSEVPVMVQMGFFFVFGAFLQGIVFRNFLTVPLMALLGDLNWFPYLQIARCCGHGEMFEPAALFGAASSSPSGLDATGLLAAGDHSGMGSGSGGQNTAASSAPRMSNLLAPPGATQSIFDNEVVAWAARESGLAQQRRHSSALHFGAGAGRGSTTAAAAAARHSNMGGSASAHQSHNASFANATRPPVEFHFTPGGQTNFGAAQQQQDSGVRRSSMMPGDSPNASSMSSLSASKK